MARAPETEVLVIGAGVFGFACAWACLQRGRRVIVAEAAAPGAGASGGLVGALAPFGPAPWDARKRFQFDALVAAEAGWRAVAAAGGVDPGYARTGRLVPLADAAARARAEAQAAAALAAWGGAAAWRLVGPGEAPGWLAPAAAASGAVLETLTARIDPRRAVTALAAAVTARGGAIRSGWRAVALESDGARFDRGRIGADAVVLAAGVGCPALAPELAVAGVKGQAALLAAAAPEGAPLIAADGIYVVPRPDGRVAVGSTREPRWRDAEATDARLDGVVARARRLCPALAEAPVVERWAGLRPRASRPDPALGPLPGRPGVFVATGGFGVGLGIALAAGELVAAMIDGAPVAPPAAFLPAAHFAAQARRVEM
jgi:glycine oxidase